jgi:hypothetical protein
MPAKKSVKLQGVKHVVYKNKKGDVLVDHTNTKSAKYKVGIDKINLTKVAGTKTVKEGLSATKKWHKNNPHKKLKNG